MFCPCLWMMITHIRSAVVPGTVSPAGLASPVRSHLNPVMVPGRFTPGNVPAPAPTGNSPCTPFVPATKLFVLTQTSCLSMGLFTSLAYALRVLLLRAILTRYVGGYKVVTLDGKFV